MTDGPDSVCSRWFLHFRGVLNVESVFDPDVLNSMEGRLPYDELDEPPTLTELKKALKSMKPGKAGGQSTILPDMILHGGLVLHHRILAIMRKSWQEGVVFSDWRNAIVVPIPKKGDLRHCDNWRGISLFDVVGKLLPV